MFNNILMPTDGSEHSERAIERGIELASLCGAKVTGIHVLPDYAQAFAFAEYIYTDHVTLANIENEEHARAAHFLDFVRKAAARAGVSCETVVATNDHPYNAIVDTANEHHCDLIIMTARHRRGLAAMLMSNEAERVLHRTSIPVLMFRALMSADHPDRMVSKEPEMGHRHARLDNPQSGHPATANHTGLHILSPRERLKWSARHENDLCS
jgi:nucleotide-binding universal stress UspA family protein